MGGPLRGKGIAVIGGCGHVGLPLGVKFALHGATTTLIDIDEKAIETVRSGKFPYVEYGGDEQLSQALELGLTVTSEIEACRLCDVVVFVIGTPVDEHLNPKLSDVMRIFDLYRSHLRPGALVVMRSTLFPGTMEHLFHRIRANGERLRR